MNRRKLLEIALSMTMPGLFLRPAWSADVVRQARSVSGFDRVAVQGVIDLVVTQGDREQLFVIAEARLMPNIVTRVERRTLIIETTGNLRTEQKLRVELTVRDLNHLEAGGSVGVHVEGLRSPALHLEVAGSADVKAARLTLELLTLRVSGSASADLAGTTGRQNVQLGGSADYRAGELDCAVASVVASGSASATLKARESLDADVSGSASVTYMGNPKIRKKVGDAASLERG